MMNNAFLGFFLAETFVKAIQNVHLLQFYVLESDKQSYTFYPCRVHFYIIE